MAKPETVRVTVRLEKDGTPVLFFVNESERGWWIDCYAHVGQHSEASREYMLSCKLQRPDALSTEAAALVREWDSLGPASLPRARVVSRLVYPKGKRYIGK